MVAKSIILETIYETMSGVALLKVSFQLEYSRVTTIV